MRISLYVFLATFLFLHIPEVGATSIVAMPYSDWRYIKEIQLPHIAEKQFVELSFDEEVFTNAAAGLRDLRIYRDGEIPYKLLVETAGVERSFLSSGPIQDLGFVQGEFTSFVLDLGEPQLAKQGGPLHSEIEIYSTSTNFRREVVVEGSDDRMNWRILLEKSIMYDYTDPEAGLKTRNTRVRYPESTARYLRVRIIDKGEAALSIQGASASFEKKTQATLVSYPVHIISHEVNGELQISQTVLDLGSSGLPNNTLTLGIPDVNFQRDVAIEGSNNQADWSVIARRDVIFSFRTPKFTGSKLSIGYPENTFRYLRATVFNKDDAALLVNGASVSGILRKLVFQAAPGGAYTLYYGNPDARYPQYDLERYFQYLETESLPQATLLGQEANPLFQEKVPPLPFSERYPWLLPGGLGIAAVALLLFLARLFFSIRKRLPPVQDQEGTKEK